MNIHQILDKYQEIISSVEYFEYIVDEKVSKLKCKIKLVDVSFLWIREIKINSKLIAYSYYWLREDNSIIIGWDNAPHYKDVKTYPHHKHDGNKVESSSEIDLENVFEFIRNYFWK